MSDTAATWENRYLEVDNTMGGLKVKWPDGSRVKLADALVALSNDGWAVVAAVPVLQANNQHHILYLKRPTRE